jgi:signal transduction histidine kinase
MPETTETLSLPANVGQPLRHQLRLRVARGLGFTATLCVAIALLLTALDGRGFGGKLVYSLGIGMSCWLVIDGVRLALAWWTERQRVRRGLAPGTEPLALGWRGLLPLLFLAVLVGPTAGLWLGDLLTGGHSRSPWSLDSATSRVTLVLSLLGTLISAFVIWMQERLEGMKIQAEAARLAQAESQLRLLQSQLEPHMLFNTLANLRVLIGLDPVRAQAMLDRLIGFLRSTLQASRRDSHPLADEFERVADYLALMQVRMGTRLRVELQLPEALRRLPVPPLILQPLVENSIQHGLEPKVDGGLLRISAQQQGSTLTLSVQDDGIGLRPALLAQPASTGFGLEQVRTRLRTLHGAHAQLSLTPLPSGGTLAVIQLPLPAASATDGA